MNWWIGQRRDGDLDTLLTGDSANACKVSQVDRNKGDGTFNTIYAGLAAGADACSSDL